MKICYTKEKRKQPLGVRKAEINDC